MLNMVAIALAPTLALLIFIYQKDRYDREPAKILFKLFIYGFFSTIPVYYVEKFLLTFNQSPIYIAFVVAGFTEELFKFLITYNIAFKIYEYNEKLDGIIYSVFTSLGFATAENLLYVLNQKNFVYTGILRGIFSVPGHMLFAISMGYYLSIAKFSDDKGNSYLTRSLIIPIILHGIYDYILFSRVYGYFIIFIAFIIFLWKSSLEKLNVYVSESKETFEVKINKHK
ncbi:MAG: PrsW family glutamic-type intramembrane protease [Caloramator sp.]|nr:PrsW family glutamic-type intramembrane protease [Caloramator sp.]